MNNPKQPASAEVAFFEWLETGQKKVVLKVADEGELSAIVHKAQM